jgi:hypothetical protein
MTKWRAVLTSAVVTVGWTELFPRFSSPWVGTTSDQMEQPVRLVDNPRVKSGNLTGALP